MIKLDLWILSYYFFLKQALLMKTLCQFIWLFKIILRIGHIKTPPLLIEIYLGVKGIDFDSFYDFSIRLWNCSESVVKNFFILLKKKNFLKLENFELQCL